ncbi:hypothetical protein LguiA_027368 [Lonicera macranthoides]
MAIQQSNLLCEEQEDQWDYDELSLDSIEEESRSDLAYNYYLNKNKKGPINNPLFNLLEQDFFWEDEELISLFSKEKQTHLCFDHFESNPFLVMARKEVVDWIVKVKEHYGFSVLTAVLAINYFDRYILSSSNVEFQKDKKPWMIQLVAVTCLSLAAKIDEIHVPLLLDLQVEDTKYVFEAKTIQRMEVIVMSILEWRMNPVTPLSFLDHIIRRLGLKNNKNQHWEFYKKCEGLILSGVADGRFVRYLPSVLATATMLHVIEEVEPCNPTDYQHQLLGALKITKEEVNECYQLMVEPSSNTCFSASEKKNPHKRKYEEVEEEMPSSPSGVIDSYFSCSDNSNDSWAAVEPLFKKKRSVQEQQSSSSSSLLLPPSLSRVFVDVVGSPR